MKFPPGKQLDTKEAGFFFQTRTGGGGLCPVFYEQTLIRPAEADLRRHSPG
jgi:hypothetical protein